LAQVGKPGPVVIDVPINLQRESSCYRGKERAFFEGVYADETHLSSDQCRRFFELLARAQRPLLYLGGGLSRPEGSRAIRRFNERFRIPVVNTLMGKGVVDETSPEALGMLGMFGTPCPNRVIQQNDFFFAVGVRWDDRVADKVGFAIQATIAYIDINPVKVRQIREERAPGFSLVGDAAVLLDELSDHAEAHDIRLSIDAWREECATIKRQWPLDYNRSAEALQQAEIIAHLDKLLPADAVVTTGVGNHQMLAAQYLRMRSPRHFLTSGSFGTMGFGMPTAVGAHFARPDAVILTIDGDGSLRMNLGELYTIGSQRLPIKILLLNNLSDGMVRNLEDSAYGGRHSATSRQLDADFSVVARTFGFGYSRRITQRSELEEGLRGLLEASGPALLEARTDIDEAVYPIVPAGHSYSEMVLGPYIRKVEG
ncbi:thiamine pyrophosphate-binding protein, partial [Myxococcota bacterium]